MGSVAKLGGSGMIVYSWDIALALNTLLSYPKMNYCDRPIHFRSQFKALRGSVLLIPPNFIN